MDILLSRDQLAEFDIGDSKMEHGDMIPVLPTDGNNVLKPNTLVTLQNNLSLSWFYVSMIQIQVVDVAYQDQIFISFLYNGSPWSNHDKISYLEFLPDGIMYINQVFPPGSFTLTAYNIAGMGQLPLPPFSLKGINPQAEAISINVMASIHGRYLTKKGWR